MTKETSTPNRVPDPWADTFAQTERLRLERVQEERLAKKERRDWIGSGLSYAFTGFLIVATILGVTFGVWRMIDSAANSNATKAEEKTKRMELCMNMEDVAERQLCVFGLNESGG